MAKLKITKTETSGVMHDRYTGPESINGSYVGGTGGLTSQTGRQIQPVVKVRSYTATTGSILAQKGAHKFQVSDENTVQDAAIVQGQAYRISSVSGTNWTQFGAVNPNTNDVFTALIPGSAAVTNNGTVQNVNTCKLVNLATPTATNTMSIAVTLNTYYANLVAVTNGATSTYVTYSTANVAGPVPVAVGQLLLGFTGNASAAVITAINATTNNGTLGNVTVSVLGNVSGQSATAISTTVYASKITNRYVWDFGNDGNGATYHNRYRYHLAAPDSTFVKVNYA
jgi:hypothetical protein